MQPFIGLGTLPFVRVVDRRPGAGCLVDAAPDHLRYPSRRYSTTENRLTVATGVLVQPCSRMYSSNHGQ
jgi:hypothetical protein